MSKPPVQFAEYYRTLENDELLNLTRQREELEEVASAALDTELIARGLGQNGFDQLEDQSQPLLESEAEDAQEESTSPQELPDDWFTDESDLPTVSPVSSRPKGVTVGAFIFWLSGFLIVGLGGFSLTVAAKAGGTALLVTGVLEIILGIASFIAGVGLWRLRTWGRKLAVALCWVWIALTAINLAAVAFLRLRGDVVDPIYVVGYWYNLFWQVLWALYLSRNHTRRAFLEATRKTG